VSQRLLVHIAIAASMLSLVACSLVHADFVASDPGKRSDTWALQRADVDCKAQVRSEKWAYRWRLRYRSDPDYVSCMKQKGYVETQLQVATSMTVTSLTGPSIGYLTPMLGDAECDAIWTKAVGGGNSLSYQKARPYITNLKLADPDNDNDISKPEFMSACKKGLVQEQS
jgi:hypothetical protein